MRKHGKLRFFFSSQFLFSFLVVMVCTFISSATSYQVLSGELKGWMIRHTGSIVHSHMETLSSRLHSSVHEAYVKLYNDMRSVPYLAYYSGKPLSENLYDTLNVQQYVRGIAGTSDTIHSAKLYYPHNNLLIGENIIRYDLFYASRAEELMPYQNIVRQIQAGGSKAIHAASDGVTLSIARLVQDTVGASCLLVLEYDIGALVSLFRQTMTPDMGNLLVFHEDGTLLFDFDGQYTGLHVQDLPALSEGFSQSKGYYQTALDGNSVVVFHQPSRSNGWRYIAVSPLQTHLQSTSLMLSNLLFSAIFTILAGFAAVMVLSVWHARPMYSVVEFYNAVSNKPREIASLRSLPTVLTDVRAEFEHKDEHLSQMLHYFREHFASWLLTQAPASQQEIDEYMAMLQIEYPHPYFYAVAVGWETDTMQGEDTHASLSHHFALGQSQLLLQEHFNREECSCSFVKGNGRLVGLVNTRWAEDVFSHFCGEFARKHGPAYAFTLSSGPSRENLLPVVEDVKVAVHALRYRYMYPQTRYFSAAFAGSRHEVSHEAFAAMHREIASFLRQREFERAANTLRQLAACLYASDCTLSQCEDVMREACEEMERAFAIGGFPQEAFSALFQSASSLDALLEEMLRHTARAEKSLREAMQGAGAHASSADLLVREAKAHVENHLTNPQLSLASTAEVLGVTGSYLSRVFGRVAGITFVEYVSRRKMELAKSLLETQSLSVTEVSGRLSYSSVQYFIARYKKYYGVTPGLSRGLHRQTHP